MAKYKDFKTCVASNQEQKSPEAFCAVAMRKNEGKSKKVAIAKEKK